MKPIRNATAAVLTTAFALTGTMTVASAELAAVPQAQQVPTLAEKFSVTSPSFLHAAPETKPDVAAGEAAEAAPKTQAPELPQVAADLQAATAHHLTQAGHHPDENSAAIAQEWADQGANGELVFYGDAASGVTHTEQGQGNVYRLSAEQAQERLNWFNQGLEVAPGPDYGYGVATTYDGDFIYIAEYFLN
ncbi:hypothetical protein [Corynebacterium macginleyi]|uniref:hypothetical protein n=1 Tax=Corynebacterium macginleyi TaxID=38290 RepID=UPI000EFA060F|nr:hypothetical protein [Corynebacterium macginleyi]QRJ59443.1 hypothetical protein GWO70_008090 [Corynebacterium macginleyi]RMB66750.1 hypothetical protein D9542_07875 [Corynebacterium macginleyi]